MVAFLDSAFVAVAAAPQSDAVDDYVRTEMARRHIPGLALAVVRNGTVAKLGHYGLADVELSVAVTDDTKFEIASMTKQFTDAAILLLAEEGKLGLDDPIARFITDAPPSWKPITVRQLMNHTAGVRDDWDEDTVFFLRNQTNEDFLKELYAFPLKFAPGEGWAYGAGPFVLGVIIEKISGRRYSEFMQERVFGPLGMTATGINDVFTVLPQRASGYRWIGGALTRGARISPAAQSRGDSRAHDHHGSRSREMGHCPELDEATLCTRAWRRCSRRQQSTMGLIIGIGPRPALPSRGAAIGL